MYYIQAFAMLKPVWRSTTLRTSTKLRLFNSNVKYILLYGSETWRETASSIKALQAFLNHCLRTILGVRRPDTIRNKLLWRKNKTATNQLNNKIKTMEVDRAHTEKGK
jgi:hypothetical protein